MNVVALFDMTGYSVRDWAEAGETCYCYQPNALEFVLALRPNFILAFPPCTDMAVSGAVHFEAKREANPEFQDEAMYMVWFSTAVMKKAQCPGLIENPVGILSTQWRKPDYIFEPFEFGGYLPENDSHPKWSEYIEDRDAYPKTTCIWATKSLHWPEKRPVEPKFVIGKNGKKWSKAAANLGGKSPRTKMIRSATPRGFARAIFEANHPDWAKTPIEVKITVTDIDF